MKSHKSPENKGKLAKIIGMFGFGTHGLLYSLEVLENYEKDHERIGCRHTELKVGQIVLLLGRIFWFDADGLDHDPFYEVLADREVGLVPAECISLLVSENEEEEVLEKKGK